MNIWENIKQTFKQGNGEIKLIYINLAVFILYNAIVIVLKLFRIEEGVPLATWLAVPSNLHILLHRLWTPITYMFFHEGFFHFLFNMLCLYWFGKIFLYVYSERHLIGLYITGGLFGALLYVIAYNIFPLFADRVGNSILLGASGSVMAIILAAATKMPDMSIRLLLIGNIKLKYIAIVTVLISFFGLTSANAGGEFAHLGGALAGYLFVTAMNKGKDITAWINKIIDWIVTLFRPQKKKMRVNKGAKKAAATHKMTDAEYNMHKARTMEEIDRILDKIKKSGYESLTTDEKRKLFEQGKK